jgi:hypothetical protein
MEEEQAVAGDAGSLDERAARVLEAIEPAEAEEGGAAEPKEAPAPKPPVSWSKDEKAAFERLPAEAQAAIARREAERERLLTTRSQELARRERELAAQGERLGHELDAVIGAVSGDPILAEGQRTDWARLQREDPAAFAQKWPAYQQRRQALEEAQRNRAALAGQHAELHLKHEFERLIEKAPELAEEQQRVAFAEALEGFLREEGFSAEEVASIHDHRAVLILRDAMRWRAQERARKTLAAKKQAKPPRTERPGGARDDENFASTRLKALRRRAANSGKLDDRAAYVLAALDDED